MDLLGASSTTLLLEAMAAVNLRIALKFSRVDRRYPQEFVCQESRDAAELWPGGLNICD